MVVSETATTGAVYVLGGFAVLSLFLHSGVTSAVITGFLAFMSLYAAVASDFIADRSRGELLVRRRVGPWTTTKAYRVETIDHVYVRHRIKGSGLAVRFKSGRAKGLTMSLDGEPHLESASGALNHFLHIPRRGDLR